MKLQIVATQFIFMCLHEAFGQGIPMSPCPKMFQYRFDGNEWFGLVSVRNIDIGQPLHLRVILSMRGKPTTNYLGEIELLTRGQFISEVPLLYKVKFPNHHFPPKLTQILVNNQILCVGTSDHSIFMTQIQLEHTRKIAFISEDLSDGRPLQGHTTNKSGGDVKEWTPSILPTNHAFSTKHLPLPSLKNNPVQHARDICGSIDDRIQPQAAQRQMTTLTRGRIQKPASVLLTNFSYVDYGDYVLANAKTDDSQLPSFASNSENDDQADILIEDILDKASETFMSGSITAHSLPSITRGSWPWLAAIYVNNLTSLFYQCGGSLASARIVVSSAHCFQMFEHSYTANEVLVFLGRHNLKNWNEEGSLAAPVEDIYIHPDFDKHLNSYDADIAVIVLKNKILFNTFIRPVCMWSGSSKLEDIEGEHGIVVGWNLGNQNNPVITSSTNSSTVKFTPKPIEKPSSTIPKIVDAPIVSNDVCFKFNKKYRSLSSNRTFCAGVVLTTLNIDKNIRPTKNSHRQKQTTGGPCTGDSGAGLMIFKNNKWMLRGTVSATLPNPSSITDDGASKNCNGNQFVIYTDVAKFLDWIFAFII